MVVSLLASGSSGNATYIQEGKTRVLVDAGLAGKQIEERLRAIGVDAAGLQAIAISHEHSDHIQGAGVLARRYRLPLYMTQGTLDAAKGLFRGTERIRVFANDAPFAVGDLGFHPFAVSHDAADPVSFAVSGGNSRLGIATDTGIVTRLVYQRLRGADMVVLEANYDREMLMNGPYPWELKQRIAGNRGHLPNDRAAETLCRLAEEGLRQAVLAHLSEQNNRPDVAMETCRTCIEAGGIREFELSAAEQGRPSPLFVL